MTDKEANDLRCYAAEIIVRLYEAGQRGQIVMLREQARGTIRHMDGDHSITADEILDWIKGNVGNIDFHVVVPAGVMSTNPWIATGPTFRDAVTKAKQQLARAVE